MTTAKMAVGAGSRSTSNSTGGRSNTGTTVPAATPTVVPTLPAMDTLIPQVPKVVADDIAARFQFETL